MTLKRMVIGLPRSGTTWAANWLTIEGHTCVHDPLYFQHYNDWAASYEAVSCTGIYDWPEFVMRQTCPVVVLRRPIAQVRASLAEFDTERHGDWLPDDAEERLAAIQGPNIVHVKWSDMFKQPMAAQLWRFLNMPTQFDATRHNQLARMRIQPRYAMPYDADMELHARLMAELRAAKSRVNAGAGA